MITLDLKVFDEQTECAITRNKSGLPLEAAKKIVKIVRYLREHGQYEFAPTVRGCIMIAKTIKEYGKGVRLHPSDPVFPRICLDILTSETSRIGSKTTSAKVEEVVKKAIEIYCNENK